MAEKTKTQGARRPKADRKNGATASGYAFGTFKGVFTPSILTILGVVMYLRFGWVLGNVGLPGTMLIVTLATAITFLTGLSLSALATNRKVEGGGAYYIISRSLGVEAGAAVGLPLFFAQALGISFYIAGFSESVVANFPLLGWTTTTVGLVTLVALTLIATISADLALKTQFIVMAAIFLSLIAFFTGGPPALEVSPEVAAMEPAPFWVVFAVFFPAVTGIEAGIAMSGDLKDPARSLPRGTISAVLTGYVVYMAIPILLSYMIADHRVLMDENNSLIMRVIAEARWGRWGQVVMLGVWAASLSSAIGALLGAPRTLQALARDRVVPRLFGRGFGKGNDPRFATATAFVVGFVGIMLGNLNVIAPVLAMFFLTSYGLLNVSAGLEQLTNPPSWRPKFRIPWWLSIAGAMGCFATMFMINAGATLMAGAVAAGVYLMMERRSMRAWWGDMRSGILMLVARRAIYALAKRKPDARTWQPNILLLSGAPTSRWYLVEMAGAISLGRSFLTVATVVPDNLEKARRDSMETTIAEYLDKRAVSALVKVYAAPTPMEGALNLVRTYGYGPIAPNTILLGETERVENYDRFAQIIRTVHEHRQNLVIVRESDQTPVTPTQRRIDVWWYGDQQNLGFMLAIASLLKRGDAWRQAELVLKSIVPDQSHMADTSRRLNDFVERVRISARCEAICQQVTPSATPGNADGTAPRSVFKIIEEHSRGADLVFMGIRSPREDETPGEYRQYYANLLKRTDNLPPTALVLAAEEVDFSAIFEEA